MLYLTNQDNNFNKALMQKNQNNVRQTQNQTDKYSGKLQIIILLACFLIAAIFSLVYIRPFELTHQSKSQQIIFGDREGNVYQSDLTGSIEKLTDFPMWHVPFLVDKQGENIIWLHLGGDLGTDFSVKEALLYNKESGSQRQISQVIDTDEYFTSYHHLSPSGKYLAYTKTTDIDPYSAENTSVVMLDLSTGEEIVLLEQYPLNAYFHRLDLRGWSQDEKKLFFRDHESTSGYRHSWFINDRIVSLDIESGEVSTYIDYQSFCDKPTWITIVENNDNLILAQCDLSSDRERIAVMVHDKETGETETLIEGNRDDIFRFILSPDGSKFVYYSHLRKAMMLYNRESGKESVIGDGVISRNQSIYFSPDSTKISFHYKGDEDTAGVHVYDFESHEVMTLSEDGLMGSWIEI